MSLSPDACRSPNPAVGADAFRAPEAVRPMLPTLLSQVLDGHTLTLQLRLDPGLVWFAGHFPGAPLLPGVAQLHLAIGYACEQWAIEERFSGLEMLKFQRPLQPGVEVTLQLSWQAESRKLQFCYQLDGEAASSGRVKL